MCMSHMIHNEVRGQPVKAGSLFPPCGSKGSNPGHQTWRKATLLAKSSQQPLEFFNREILSFFPKLSINIIYTYMPWDICIFTYVCIYVYIRGDQFVASYLVSCD